MHTEWARTVVPHALFPVVLSGVFGGCEIALPDSCVKRFPFCRCRRLLCMGLPPLFRPHVRVRLSVSAIHQPYDGSVSVPPGRVILLF